ncbi:hypothetical protein BT63DRAFT_430281 [Microthyrium microscopicum]|uniref:Ecp2 effector protein domain-containing protein n=1 Tax=Microthyrium microscopicum TaxID=703497 RepID=A0A6A6TUJ9_9PEZI|nr:hypothetical protein BT63DRAFT_430281 [Microthyrium microscopicum]
MRLFAIFATIVGALGAASAVALPAPTYQQEAQNVTIAGQTYPLLCNQLNLNLKDIDYCIGILMDSRGQVCWTKPKDSGTFCQKSGVFVSGTNWGDNGPHQASCQTEVEPKVQMIRDRCGSRGGSIGVHGTQNNDLVVHVADHWV